MPIGTSDGQQFDSEYEHLASTFNLTDFQPIQERVTPDLVKGVTGVAGEAIKRTSELLMAPGEAYKGNLTPDQITESGIGLALMVGGTSTPFAAFKPGLGMFGGRYSKEALTTAQQMEKAGFGPAGIKEMTGLERGAEGAWRREFGDQNAKLNLENFKPSYTEGLDHAPLGAILKHDNLFAAYPDAADIRVYHDPGNIFLDNPRNKGTFFPDINTLVIKKGLSNEETKSVILHELQHWIQEQEGFATGANSGIIRSLPKDVRDRYVKSLQETYPGHPYKPDYFLYRSVAGEQEAFNVQSRMNMSDLERRQSPAVNTETIPRKHQLILRESGVPLPTATDLSAKQSQSDVNPVEHTYLAAFRAAEKIGLGGKALSLYNDIVQRGRTEPITEKDFDSSELTRLKNIVEKKVKSSGKTSGKIDYPDYAGTGEGIVDTFRNILGGFKYKVNEDGSINVKDVYDFNLLPNKVTHELDNNPIVEAILGPLNPVGLAAHIGRKVISNAKGKGISVDINIK